MYTYHLTVNIIIYPTVEDTGGKDHRFDPGQSMAMERPFLLALKH